MLFPSKQTCRMSLLTCVLLIYSCATLQVSHTTRVAESEGMLKDGSIRDLVMRLDANALKNNNNKALSCFQSGYYHMYLQEYPQSIQMFQEAENEIRRYEEKAVISASDALATASSIVASDMELPYKGEGFEKVMLSTLQALALLFQGDLEGAGVEVRRADLRQKREEETHQRDLEKIEQEKSKNSSQKEGISSLESQLGALDAYASKVVNSFQNGFTYFLAGLVQEVNGSPNDAYIDYKKCFALHRTRTVLEKLASLSQQLGFREEFRAYQQLARELFQCEVDGADDGRDLGKFVLIYFHDQVPQKIQAKFTVPLEGNLMNIAFPFYDMKTFSRGEASMEASVDGVTVGRTEVVLDFVPIIAKALKEKAPGMALRQIARALAKREINIRAEKKFGYLGKLTANLVNTVTERADLRGWYELPSNIQVLTGRVAPGEKKAVKLQRIYGSQNVIVEANQVCDFRPGRATLILAHSLAGMLAVHYILL